MKILDACCGSKMFWYDKHEPHTTYIDNRSEKDQVKDRQYIRDIVVSPDIIADFRKLPFKNDEFDLVTFDPPHLIHAGDNSWLKLKYGCLPNDWSTYIKAKPESANTADTGELKDFFTNFERNNGIADDNESKGMQDEHNQTF